jgi:hypothetical protein
MKRKHFAYIILLSLVVFSCKEDEDPKPSIVGKWKGTLAEIEVKPFGLPTTVSKDDENFAAEIEFKSDGTMILLENAQPVEGTYHIMGDQLMTDIDFQTDALDLSGNYVIEELTQNKLVVFLEKDGSVTDPGTGVTITGDIKATLHFDRQ